MAWHSSGAQHSKPANWSCQSECALLKVATEIVERIFQIISSSGGKGQHTMVSALYVLEENVLGQANVIAGSFLLIIFGFDTHHMQIVQSIRSRLVACLPHILGRRHNNRITS